MAPTYDSPSPQPDGALLAVGAAFGIDRVPSGRARRCAARPDEDAITLAAQAGAEALRNGERPVALLLATTTPPYDEGGSVQVLAELLRLAPDVWASELTATARDGLAALRVALALARVHDAPVLVCAAHAASPHGAGEEGDGAVALLVGPAAAADAALAQLTAGPAHVEELRDRWRLRGDAVAREGDASFIYEYGGSRLASLLGARAVAHFGAPGAGGAGSSGAGSGGAGSSGAGSGGAGSGGAGSRGTGSGGAGSGVPVSVAALSVRAAARAEAGLGGPGDDLVSRTGILGTAHPLLRLACGLDAHRIVAAVAGGLAETVHVAPGPGGPQLSERVRARARGGVDREAPFPEPSGAGFDPYASGPRAWRERAQDLRLEGVLAGGKLSYPPPALVAAGSAPVMQALSRLGTVLTHTRDHVYPGGEVTGMAVLELDDGARFYCQVAMGEEVQIGTRARLVPRRLHQGGGVVQYFWKAVPCQ